MPNGVPDSAKNPPFLTYKIEKKFPRSELEKIDRKRGRTEMAEARNHWCSIFPVGIESGAAVAQPEIRYKDSGTETTTVQTSGENQDNGGGLDADKIMLHENAMWQWMKAKYNCQNANCCEGKNVQALSAYTDCTAKGAAASNNPPDDPKAVWRIFRKDPLVGADNGDYMMGGDILSARGLPQGASWYDGDDGYPIGQWRYKDMDMTGKTRYASAVWVKKYSRRTMGYAFGEGGKPTENNFVNMLAAHVFQVTSWHKWSANNVPYMSSPQAGSTQNRWRDQHGDLNTLGDTDAFYMSTAITILTSMRTPPLLGDWSQALFSRYNMHRPELRGANAPWDKAIAKSRAEAFTLWHRDYKLALAGFAIHTVYPNDQTRTSGEHATTGHSFPGFNPAYQEASVAI